MFIRPAIQDNSDSHDNIKCGYRAVHVPTACLKHLRATASLSIVANQLVLKPNFKPMMLTNWASFFYCRLCVRVVIRVMNDLNNRSTAAVIIKLCWRGKWEWRSIR